MRAYLTVVLLLGMSGLVPAQEIKKEDPDNPIVIIKTNHGAIYAELFAKEAPKTVKNFVELAEGKRKFTDPKAGKKVKRPFYDGLIFHRVIKRFMAQGGCPLGSGSGGPGYAFADEINANALGLDKMMALDPKTGQPHRYLLIRSVQDFDRVLRGPLVRRMGIRSQEDLQQRMEEVQGKLKQLTLKACYENLGYKYNDKLKSHRLAKGVLAMANSGPNTNGSQFFITLADTPWLTGKHTVFGKVVKGMEVVAKIGQVPVAAGSKPVEDVKILSIRLQKQKK